jgi:hypothetical protein
MYLPKTQHSDSNREKRSNETHASTTDPDAKLFRKGHGQESRLCYLGHVLMENRHGLAVTADVTQATARRNARRPSTWNRHRPGQRRITLGADKLFDVEGFIEAVRERKVTPHIAIDGHLTKTGKRRKTAIDERTLRHPGYAISQCCRKRIEEVFGWIKTVAGLAQVKVRGLAKVLAVFIFAILAYNLVRALELLAVGAMIEYEVVGPDLVRPGRGLRPRPRGRNPLPRPLARHLQPRRPPQPVRPARAHAVAVAAQEHLDAPVAIARILRRQVLHPREHGRVLHSPPALIARRRAARGRARRLVRRADCNRADGGGGARARARDARYAQGKVS